jgi:hypothetical protein
VPAVGCTHRHFSWLPDPGSGRIICAYSTSEKNFEDSALRREEFHHFFRLVEGGTDAVHPDWNIERSWHGDRICISQFNGERLMEPTPCEDDLKLRRWQV